MVALQALVEAIFTLGFYVAWFGIPCYVYLRLKRHDRRM